MKKRFGGTRHFIRLSLTALVLAAIMTGCGPGRYHSAHHQTGMSHLAGHRPIEATVSFTLALDDAARRNDINAKAQIMAVLGWAMAEAGDLAGARRQLNEAIAIAEAAGIDASVMYARLAVVASKGQDAETATTAAEKALALTAERWRKRAGGGSRDAVIDYAVGHAGLPPDEDMIRAVVMAETALAVSAYSRGDFPAAGQWARRTLAHTDALGFVMNMAPAEDRLAFFQGQGVAAGVARAVAENRGDAAAAAAYLATGRTAFERIGIPVQGDDLLGAYMASGGQTPAAGAPGGGDRFSPEYEAAMAMWNDGRLGDAYSAFMAAADTAGRSGRRTEQIRAISQAGWIQAEQGRYGAALTTLAKSIAVDPASDETAMSRTRTAAIQARLGNTEKALAEADRAMDVAVAARPGRFHGKNRRQAVDRFIDNPGLPPDVLLLKAILGSEAARTVAYYFEEDWARTAATGARAMAHYQAAEPVVAMAGRREQRDFYDGMGYTAMATGDALSFLGKADAGRQWLGRAKAAFEKSGSRFGIHAADALEACTYLRDKQYREAAGRMAVIWRQLEQEGYEDILWRTRSRFAYYFDRHARELNAQLTNRLGRVTDARLTPAQRRWQSEAAAAVGDTLSAVAPLFPRAQLAPAGRALTRFRAAATGTALHTAGQALFRDVQEIALSNYEAALDHIESVRSMLETDLNKRAFRADKSMIYEGYIRLSTELHGAAAGLEALERAKARNLLDLLATREVAFRPTPEARELDDIRTALQTAADAGRPGTAAHEAVVAEQTRRYRAIVVSARQQSPELASFLSVTYPSTADVQGMLPKGAALLAYHLTDDGGYVFAVTPGKVTVATLGKGRIGLTPMVAALRKAIVDMDAATTAAASAALYAVLIAPVAEDLAIDRMIISPDGILFYLPFAALQQDGRYLAARYSLAITPSAGVLGYALAKRRADTGPMLALGNPDLGDPAMDLPQAENEARTVAALFPGSSVLVRGAATESMVRARAGDYAVLHLATHGEFSGTDPLYSALRLAPDDHHDGHLETGEIFSLDLKAAMVVLSACQTGLGRITEGGEIIGMTRAFLYAGTPSVIASLWNVDDASTALLMTRFYENLKTMPRDAALRAAQMDIMHTGDYAAPYYWAAFTLTGAW